MTVDAIIKSLSSAQNRGGYVYVSPTIIDIIHIGVRIMVIINDKWSSQAIAVLSR